MFGPENHNRNRGADVSRTGKRKKKVQVTYAEGDLFEEAP